jgi:quercetin dioxygenase-like cupin family protein
MVTHAHPYPSRSLLASGALRSDGRHLLRNNSSVAIAFVTGCICGMLLSSTSSNGLLALPAFGSVLSSSRQSQGGAAAAERRKQGVVVNLGDLPMRPTSHKDEQGRPILKQQLLEPFAAPRVTGFSVATLQPNQRVERHGHANMHEFFYVVKGQGAVIQVDEEDHVVQEGTFVWVPPGSPHAVYTTSVDELQMLVVGVTTDDGKPPPPPPLPRSK